MNERIRRQQLQLMVYNLIAFSLIFTLFGFIQYGQIRGYLIEPIREELVSTSEHIAGEPDFIDRQLLFAQQAPFFDKEPEGEPPDGNPDRNMPRNGGTQPPEEGAGDPKGGRISMRMQIILRDISGEVVNPYSLGYIFFDEYLKEIPVASAGEFGEIVNFTVAGSPYIALTFPMNSSDGNEYTVQLITNVDGEQSILSNFTRLMVLCIVVFVLLSLLASYLLSKKTMAPILRAWNRQAEFVGNASHELRTPLTIIQNKLESMLVEPQATVMDKADDIGVSLSETRRLSRLTTDLMTLARADSSETQLEKERFTLDELVETVCEPYAELAMMQEKTLDLMLEYAGLLLADKNRIHELMVILLDNALKYTHEGDSITVRTELQEGRAVIEVEDTGIGIPEESRRRVFDRFYRTDKARSREHGGSGLGLSIAKWIVDEHEGSITVHPGVKGGTLFRVRLKVE